jgi:Tripartite tricarboxylate transporter TctB family
LLFVALGVGVFVEAWTMPRLENRGVHPLTIPGLTPGLLALALILCGGLLTAKAWRAGAGRTGWIALAALARGREAVRVGAALLLVLLYTLVLVGWLPFGIASALFVFVFIATFEIVLPSGPVRMRQTLVWGAGVAAVTGAVVIQVFERVFLVRLP